MIHIHDQDFKGEVEQVFDEAFMTHTSTSPNYQLIASLDVGRRQVELEGFEFVQKQVNAAMTMRRTISDHPLLKKYFTVLSAGDMIPEAYRESGMQVYWDADAGWSDFVQAWADDEFVLDPTRITLAVGLAGLDGDTFKTQILMDQYGIQVNKTSRNSVLFMTNIGTTRSSVAYLIEVLVKIARELDQRLDDASQMERRAFERQVKSLVVDLPSLPDFSRFHDAFRPLRRSRARRRPAQRILSGVRREQVRVSAAGRRGAGQRDGSRPRAGVDRLRHPLSAGLSPSSYRAR